MTTDGTGTVMAIKKLFRCGEIWAAKFGVLIGTAYGPISNLCLWSCTSSAPSGYWKTHLHHPTQPGYPVVDNVVSINSELGSKQHSITVISWCKLLSSW